MTEFAQCKLKVLVVISGDQWRLEGRRDELGEKLRDRLIFCTIEQKLVASGISVVNYSLFILKSVLALKYVNLTATKL
jgi:hypothetical protein